MQIYPVPGGRERQAPISSPLRQQEVYRAEFELDVSVRATNASFNEDKGFAYYKLSDTLVIDKRDVVKTWLERTKADNSRGVVDVISRIYTEFDLKIYSLRDLNNEKKDYWELSDPSPSERALKPAIVHLRSWSSKDLPPQDQYVLWEHHGLSLMGLKRLSLVSHSQYVKGFFGDRLVLSGGGELDNQSLRS